ncbi:MAG: DNA-protecting protein DprA, partial [Paramuribaculum sp.]|nr:DNA-protecting protein DprA [Paramuribaculum sp.]
LPGRVTDRYSQGCNNLCARQLAHVITSPDDLIEAMGWPRKEVKIEQQSLFSDLNSVETLIVDYLLSHDTARVNELAVNLNLAAGKVMSILVDLEFRGIVTSIPGGAYRCLSPN